MKTNKVIVVTEEYSCVVNFSKEIDLPKERIMDMLQNSQDFKSTNVLDIADANTHHICKYCGEIVNGTDEDVLCSECRETFGHAFYSEL